MKKINIIILFIFGLLFSGCAMKPYVPQDNVSVDKDGIINVEIVKNEKILREDEKTYKTYKDRNYRGNVDLIKRSLLISAQKTLEKNKTNFIILNPEMNHLNGFNLTTYSDIKEFCLRKDREPNKIKIICSSFLAQGMVSGSLKILPVDNTDYRIFSINANKIIEEINKSE